MPYYAVQKTRKIFAISCLPSLRVVIGVLTFLLLGTKLASPFLHTHHFLESASTEIGALSVHCDACDYEATQGIDPGSAVILPTSYFAYESIAYETRLI